MESSMTYDFLDLYTDVAEFAGWTRSPSTTDLASAKRRVNDAYRRFLNAHDWKFLKQIGVLTTEDGKWAYELPDNFSELVIPFKYPADSSWDNPQEVDAGTILELKTGTGTTSGRPYCFAIRNAEFSESEGTRYEAIFHYTPNSAWAMSYTYRILVNELVNDGDVPIGGAEHSQTIRTYCLAEVELFDEEKGGNFSIMLEKELQNSIRKDNRKAARTVGVMTDPSTSEGVSLNRRENTIYYNGISVD